MIGGLAEVVALHEHAREQQHPEDRDRERARRRVAEILGSLALYYLPPIDPAAPALIGARRQIEPA